MIEVRDLVYRYDGEAAVDGVSLTIPDGEFLLLVGPNGSGKTTLVRHFDGLLEPDAGTVAVDGRDVTEHPVAARTSVGMVFQHPRDQFVAATVGADVAFGPENLGLDRAEIDRRVEDALAAVNMAGRADERIDALSGGEQARVAVAGALAMDPDHLVLDEPLAGLDRPARESLRSRLADLHADGTGIVVVTHDAGELLDLADRVVGLGRGRVAFDEPPERAREELDRIGVGC
ncbi:energy-coupling factor ABC transporter ATP-binding protein [Halomicrobium salinisoli]|uniref:energy-coupling factor ABC transporter ATP-binding protein n=1 Tax=Halomicrobium salinisoli TaxID=2878391 RepID=UPI001CF0AF70|nr:ABC transporter ATP-binding protein [Halomicrobium salinisoli]